MIEQSGLFKTEKFKIKKLVFSVASALAISVSGGLHAENTDVIDLSIKGQRAGTALLELARSASVQIMVPNGVGETVQLSSIEGQYTLLTALDEMLQGTGLTYEFRSDDSVVIKKIVADEEGAGGQEEEEVDEEIVVTGSAIRNVNPTSATHTITSKDIERLGLSSAEDIVRSLPQNFSDHNGAVTLGGGGTGGITSELGIRQDAAGTSAANLRGLGNDATLILINGHRTAQSPLFENNGINLATIPASAIDRVEIVLDGASARYGSDAVAGVINFIMKKNYSGAESSIRYENSINDAHVYRFSQTVGFGWDTGSIVGVLSYEERNSPNSRELGFTSRDNRFRGGTDLRNPGIGVTGVVRDFTLSGGGNVVLGDVVGALPSDFDGTSFTEADLSLDNIVPADTIREDQGSTTENTTLYVTLNQEITNNFSVYLDGLYSESEARASQVIPSTIATSGLSPEEIFSFVPASNAFNSLGRDVIVSHSFVNEVNNGLVPPNIGFNKTDRLDINTGFIWDTSDDWQVRVNLGYSEEAASTFRAGLSTQDGVSEEYVNLIASSDPAEAINLFGNGTVQSPLLGSTYTTLFETNPSSENLGLEVVADGKLFDLNGSEIRGAVGVEYRLERRDYNNDSIRGVEEGFFDPRSANPAATAEPERDVMAAFVEIDLPLVNEDMNIPLVKNLQLNIGARWEEYTIAEAFEPNLEAAGFDFENPPFFLSGRIEDISPVNDATFNQVSPRVGLRWDMSDSFAIRASWGESFRAPSLFDYTGTPAIFFINFPVFGVDDPLDDIDGRIAVPRLFGGNAKLSAETSTNTSVGFDWQPEFVEGLVVQVNYTKIDFEDRIATPFSEFGDQALLLPEVGTRNSDGKLILVNVIPFNLASKSVEAVDFSISYPFSNELGDFNATFAGTYTGTLEDVLFPGNDPINRLNTDRGPSDWRGRASLNWSQDNYSASLFVNYTGAFQYELRPGFVESPRDNQQVRTEEYWTVDLTGSYQLPDSGWSFIGGIRDLFHTPPPFFNNRDPNLDASRVSTRGRVMYLEAKKTFDF